MNITIRSSFTNETIIRIITQPYQYMAHPEISLPNEFLKAKCFIDRCPFCKNTKRQPRWIVGLINRNNNQVEILEFGSHLFSIYRNYAQNPNYGNPVKYDYKISTYNIIPCNFTPLSIDDIELSKQLEKSYLFSLVEPL